jgi:methionine sulfoxide reductase heme-binding subunit
MTAIAAAGPSAYWYLTRGSGAAALLLLTASVVLGVLDSVRFSSAPRWPRFAIDSLHRDVSLLVIVLLVFHILTSVLDGFAPITLLDAVIPFVSAYRPLWLGLGAVAFDLLLALVVTSLLRRRLGYRTWRAIHWLAYASWPVAVLHGLGTGTDAKSWWLLALTFVCVGVVLIAVLARIGRAGPGQPGIRAGAVVLSVATPIGLAVFALAGPLSPGWARRAGTPARLLASVRGPGGATSAPAGGPLDRPFTATLSGTLSQKPAPQGMIVQMLLHLGGSASGVMRVRIGGASLAGGGVSLAGSQVDVAAAGMPSAMQGQIVSLQGYRFTARVSDASGTVVDLRADLDVDSDGGAVTGSLSGTPVLRTGG